MVRGSIFFWGKERDRVSDREFVKRVGGKTRIIPFKERILIYLFSTSQSAGAGGTVALVAAEGTPCGEDASLEGVKMVTNCQTTTTTTRINSFERN